MGNLDNFYQIMDTAAVHISPENYLSRGKLLVTYFIHGMHVSNFILVKEATLILSNLQGTRILI